MLNAPHPDNVKVKKVLFSALSSTSSPTHWMCSKGLILLQLKTIHVSTLIIQTPTERKWQLLVQDNGTGAEIRIELPLI